MAYFDAGLDHLSCCYDHPGRVYFVLLENRNVIGGVGLSVFPSLEACCELQTLYLAHAAKGRDLGCRMTAHIGNRARDRGCRQIYLEPHTFSGAYTSSEDALFSYFFAL